MEIYNSNSNVSTLSYYPAQTLHVFDHVFDLVRSYFKDAPNITRHCLPLVMERSVGASILLDIAPIERFTTSHFSYLFEVDNKCNVCYQPSLFTRALVNQCFDYVVDEPILYSLYKMRELPARIESVKTVFSMFPEVTIHDKIIFENLLTYALKTDSLELFEERLDCLYRLKVVQGNPLIRCKLMLCGDVETNPGPVMSKFDAPVRDNCFSAWAQLKPADFVQMEQVEDAPRPRCRLCGLPDGDCKCKRYALQAAGPLLSVMAGLIRIIRAATEATAQIGFGVTETLESVRTCMNAAAGATEETQGLVGSLKSFLSGLPTMVNDVLDSNCGILPVSIRTVLTMGLSLVGVYVFYRFTGLSVAFVDTLLRIVGAVMQVPVVMLEMFRNWLVWTTEPVAQVGGDETNLLKVWVPVIVPFFFSIVTTGLIGKLPCKELTPDLWMRRVADFPRACRGLGDIYTYLKNWIEYAIAYVEKQVWGIEPGTGTFPQVEAWMAEVIEASRDLQKACATTGKAERIAGLWTTGSSLLRKYQSQMPREVTEAVKRTLVLAAKVGEQAKSLYIRPEGVRMVPQLLWFTGESQIGKTSMKYFLAAEILNCFGMADLVTEHVYTRAPENEFFDGYNNQYVVIYDDWGQLKDTVANPSAEMFELIRAISNHSYPLHMADISQKTGSFFTSKCVICSTNDRNIRIESLTYPDAVWNRFTFGFDVRLKPEYQLRIRSGGREVVTLDKEKAARDAPVIDGKKQTINLDVYEFYQFDPKQRNRPEFEAPISFSEMCALVVEDMKKRMARGDSLKDDVNAYAKRLAQGPMAQVGDVFFDAKDDLSVRQLLEWASKVLEQDEVTSDRAVLAMSLQAELHGVPEMTLLENIEEDQLLFTYEEIREMYAIPFVNVERAWLKKKGEAIRKVWDRVKERVTVFHEKLCVPVWVDLKKWLKKMFIEHPTKILLGGLGLVGILYWLRTETKMNQSESHNPTTQPKHKQLAKFSKDRVLRKTKAEVYQAPARHVDEPEVEGESQIAADPMQYDMIRCVFKQQYLICPVKDGVEIDSIGVMTMLKGSVGMMPYHFFVWLKAFQPQLIRLRSAFLPNGIEMQMKDFLNDVTYFEQQSDDPTTPAVADVCFLNLFTHMPPAKDITSYFMSYDDLPRVEGSVNVALSGPRPTTKREFVSCVISVGTAKAKTSMRYGIASPNGKELQPIYTRNLYEYNIPTVPGYCGQLLSITSSVMQKKIFGMHVAGSVKGINWSHVVTIEDIRMFLDSVKPVAQMAQNFSDRPIAVKTIPGEFVPVCDIIDGPYENVKTTIIPSSMHGKLTEPTTIPAKLQPFIDPCGQLKDPLCQGVQKAGKSTPTCDGDLLKIAEDDLYRTFAETKREPLRVLTIEEAIAGVPGDDMRNPISATTSTGYGWTKRGKGKTYYIGKDGFDPSAPGYPELVARVTELIGKLERGEQVDMLSLDCLKDERRPKEKVLAGKTRVFTVLPMELNVVIRMYFMEAIVLIRSGRIRNGTGVGLNVWSEEWDYMYKLLSEVSTKNTGDGDFGNLDGTLMSKILWSVFRVLDRLYDDEHTAVREALWAQLVYCIRHYRGLAYQCTHSLPSGIFGTSDFGSMYLLLAFRYIWMRIAPKHLKTMRAFGEHVRIVTYGDDNIWSVSDVAAQFWNMSVLTKEFELLGMVYTDAAKTGDCVDFKNISEIQFLKRFFVWSPHLNRMTCPAELTGRLETLNWTRRNSTVDSRIIESDCVQDVLVEVAAHGKAVFDEWAPKIVKNAIDSGVPNVHLEGFLYYHCPRDIYKHFGGLAHV